MPQPRRALWAVVVALFAASISVAAFAPPASATPPAAITTTYTVASQLPTSVRTAAGNSLVAITETASFTGAITGDATGAERFLFRPDGSFELHLKATCLCSVAGKTGTLEFQVQGGGGSEGASGTITGVGSDGLQGVHLNGTWSLAAAG